MHVVFFNHSYYPDPEATGQYLCELAEDLVAKGEKVSIVCGRSYHINETWRSPLRFEHRNGVRIVRIFNTRLSKSNFLFRLVNLLFYFAGCLLAIFLLPRPDAVVAHTDPPLLPLIAGLYARLTRARFVYSINDLYPDVAIELGQISKGPWLNLLELATSFGLRHADCVTVLGEDMKAKVLRKAKISQKLAVIRNWADIGNIQPRKEHNTFRREHGFEASDFIVMYSGNLGLSQRLDDVLRVAADMQNLKDIRFVFIGAGAMKRRLIDMARHIDGTTVFLPYQPRHKLDESLSAADLHLVPLARGVAGSIVPCKVYGIMASGTPFIALTDKESDVARIAEEFKCGFWCPTDSTDKLKRCIQLSYHNRRLLKTMGRKGRRAAESHFSRSLWTDRYHKMLLSLS